MATTLKTTTTTTTPSATYFPRPQLANDLAEQLFDTTFGPSSGLFLAAPRRTGKSTFVRNDLVPALAQRKNADVIYVDLWANKNTDPAILISNAIRSELQKQAGTLAKIAAKAGISKLSLGAFGTGLNFDLSALGLGADLTLANVLSVLSRESQRPVVLVIDEAQHALTTANGINALFALKAARDELNLGAAGLYLVATGSNRDKLATMVHSREQAFFGADLLDFPTLGKDYLRWLFEKAALPLLDIEAAFKVFQKVGSRPEMINPALRRLKFELAHPYADTANNEAGQVVVDANARFSALVEENASAAKAAFFSAMAQLPALQLALLSELAVQSRWPDSAERSGIFSTKMIQKLQQRLIQQGSPTQDSEKIDSSSIQNALESLREKSLLWRAQRGAYWIEEEQHVQWLIESLEQQENA